MTILITAHLAGGKVGLLVNDNNAPGGFCTVKAVPMGELKGVTPICSTDRRVVLG